MSDKTIGIDSWHSKDIYVQPGLEKFVFLDRGRNLHKTIGLKLTHVEKGLIRGKLEVTEDLQQPYGLLHGGVSISIIEGLGSVGANILSDEWGLICVGLEVNGNHVTGVQANIGATIVGESRCIHRGKTTQIWQTKITEEKSSKLVCIGRLTCFTLPKSKL